MGEPTGGGAHLVEIKKVNNEINLWTPTARAHNYVTESNWEGVGVQPDIAVESSDAMSAAIKFLKKANN